MIFFFNQYLSFIFRIGLTLGYYHPVYSVSSGIYKKGKKFMDTVYYQRSSLQNILSLIFLNNQLFLIFISAVIFIKLKHSASRYKQCNSFLFILKFNIKNVTQNILGKDQFSQFLFLLIYVSNIQAQYENGPDLSLSLPPSLSLSTRYIKLCYDREQGGGNCSISYISPKHKEIQNFVLKLLCFDMCQKYRYLFHSECTYFT